MAADAVVVFHDHGAHILDPLLKHGFRHVFCCVRGRANWISIDGRGGLPVVEEVGDLGLDIVKHYRDQGFTVVEYARQGPLRWPLVVTNCVGMVKAVLGINAVGVVTPYQLYRRLTA